MTLLARLGILVSFAILSVPHISGFARAQEKYTRSLVPSWTNRGSMGWCFRRCARRCRRCVETGVSARPLHEINIAGFPGVVVPGWLL